MEDEFVIPASKLDLLKQYGERIYRLFGVSLAELPSDDKREPQAWIRLSSTRSQQDVQDVQWAKEYIVSLVSDDTQSRPEVEDRYDSEHFEILLQNRDKIEASSRAVVNFSPANLSVRIRGLPMHILLAKSYIQDLIQRRPTNLTDGLSRGVPAYTGACNIGSIPGGSAGNQLRSRGDSPHIHGIGVGSSMSPLSPGAESRDSCYDSGDEAGTYADIVSSNISNFPQHYKYMTSQSSTSTSGSSFNIEQTTRTSSSPVCHSGSPSSSSSDPELDRINTDMAKVEFGIKLGYEESQVISAINKLGLNPSKDQLLAELVKASSGKPETEITGRDSNLQERDSNLQERDLEEDCSLEMSTSKSLSVPLLSVNRSISPNISSAEMDSFNWSRPHISSGLDTFTSDSVPDEDVLYPHSGDTEEAIPEYRHIVIDGSNVAMSHGNKERFSCRGIRLAVDWFRQKGCKNITVFVPQWRRETSRPDAQITDQHILQELEKEQILTFTPSRRAGGKRIVCYDDRYVLKHALDEDGIIVSNDNYRDLQNENPEFKRIVDERLLMYSFVRDKFMPPEDPLGRYGPSLENFLRNQPTCPQATPIPCPYGKKCTYGNKCKYYHPERGNLPHKSVTDKLAEESKKRMMEVKERGKNQEERRKSGKKKKVPTATLR